MRTRFKKRAKATVKAITLGGVCCTVIYASMILAAAKSFLKVQSNPIDL